MKQKLFFFFLTAFLSLIGGGELWAESVIFYLANGSSSDTRVTPVSLSTSGSFQTDNDKPYRNGLRIDAGGYIELTADAGYSISQVQITFTPDDNNDPITYIRSSGLTSITINTDETASWGQTFSNKNYTTYGVLTRTLVEPRSSIRFSFDGSSGSVYVKQLDVTYSVDNRSEIAVFSSTNTWPTVYNYVDNVPSSMIIRDPQNNGSSNFVIKIVATNEEVSSGTYLNRFDTNKLHVSVEDPTVITLGTVHHQNYSGTSGNRQQMYFSEFTILKEGSTRIVVSFDGDENYLPKTVYYDITTKNIRHSSLYSSYPFTWDFANNDWESSKIQLNASDNWNSVANSATNKYGIEAVDCYDIDLLKGLKLTAAANGITADWQNKKLTITGSITLPDLLRGYRVSIVSSAEPSSVPANLTLKSSTVADGKYTNVYFVSAGTTNPEIVFSSATDIYSIAVEKTRAELVLNTTETSNGTSSYLAANPPTLNLGTSQSWGNYCFDIIDGLVTATETVPSPDYTVTITPAGILHARYGVEYASANTTRLVLTADAVGTAHVSVAINPSGDHGYEVVSPYEFDVRVVQNATPHKWNFEDSEDYWTTTSGQLNASYWVESADATANPGEVMSNVAFSGEELTKDGTNKIPEMEGLVMTAVKGSSRFNIGKYYRLGNYSKASITIPSMTTGQTVTFKVQTATSGMERGITATSSNLELISGQVSDKVSYYTFRVTSDGDGEFRQTSEVAGLKIYYIDLKAATPAATELKFVDSSNNDISNKQVNIVSGVSGALDSYFQLSKSSGTWNDVTVTVDPSSLLTYDSNGTFTMGSGTGTATITARTESSSVETGIAVLYVSIKNQPTVTLSANGPFSVNYGQDFNDNTSTVTGSSSAGLTVLYKSSNERVATVDASGHVTCVGVGTATITAYTEETNEYLPAEASYQLTYNAGNVVFQFEPSEVKLALGKNITPFLHYDQSGQLDASTLTSALSKSGVVTCEVVTDAKQSDKKVIKITSVNDASKIGETVIVTASATMKNSSVVYNTTIAVTITAADAVNFDWVKGDDIYVYENTYIPIPGYNGNASGNNHFSNGPDNSSTHHAYLYKKNGGGSPVWNNQNYKLNQGVPDYYVNDIDKALIFWATSDKSNYPDTLLVYAKAAGTVTLHAKDSQTDAECNPITIHILAKSGLEAAHTAEVNTISFPYTWDFTKDFSESDFTNSMFWEDYGSGRYINTAVWMNDDWANEVGGGKFPVNFLGSTGAGSPIALFKGAQLQLGNSTYNSKIGRLQIKPNAGEGYSHLTIIGGQHYLYLPEIPVERTPNAAYRLYVKAKGQSTTYNKDGSRKDDDCSRIIVSVDNGSGEYTNLDTLVYAEETKGSNYYIVKCLYCDIPAASAGKKLRLNFDKNVELHWIALSTEQKLIKRQSNTTYHAATYSYGQDLDIAKSEYANPSVKAYYTNSFTNGKTLALTRISENVENVPSGTGIMLKANMDESYENVSSYMIASARNTDSYSTPSSLSGNLLLATPATGTVASQETIGDKTYTNFLLSYRYKTYDWENGSTVNDSYTNAPDWVFYRIKPGGIASSPNMAYLHVEGNMFVDANGNIVNLSRRNSASEETDNQDGPIAPASQNMLKIIFLDEDPIEDSGTTDISTVNERTIDTDAWYTLQGVRVNAPAKGGIYIHKGKKVVVK